MNTAFARARNSPFGRAAAVPLFTLLICALALTGCSIASPGGNMPAMNGDGTMMGGSNSYADSPSRCASTPTSLPGSTVRVTLGDMGMTQMLGGIAPMGGQMRLLASPGAVPSGPVSFVVRNQGWRTHELVILPLNTGATGQRTAGTDGKVIETGSLGEASANCAAGAGDGIPAGSTSWVTVTLSPGRYELICNIVNHYADGMHQGLTVT